MAGRLRNQRAKNYPSSFPCAPLQAPSKRTEGIELPVWQAGSAANGEEAAEDVEGEELLVIGGRNLEQPAAGVLHCSRHLLEQIAGGAASYCLLRVTR